MGSTNIDQQQIQADKVLDEFEEMSGLPAFNIFDISEVSRYLAMNMTQMSKMSSIECAQAAYLVAQYAFYIQRLYNRESAKEKWLNNKLIEFTCDKLDDYPDFTKYENKIALIAKENSVVKRIRQLQNQSRQILERLSFLATSLKNVSDNISNLQKAQYYQQKGSI